MYKFVQEHVKGVTHNLIANLIIYGGATMISWYTAHQAALAGIPQYITVLIGVGAFLVLALSFALIAWAISKLRPRKVDADSQETDQRVYMATEERQLLLDERKAANEKYLAIKTAHDGCERTIQNLQSTISRWEKNHKTLEVRHSTLERDLNDARANAEQSLKALGENESLLLQLTEEIEQRENKLQSLGAELAQHKTSQLDIVFKRCEPYVWSVEAGSERRVEFYIGIVASVLVEDLVVEVDAYHEEHPERYRELYHLHEKGDDPPYQRSYFIGPDEKIRLFPVYTVIEEIKKTPSLGSYKTLKIEINEDVEIPSAFTIIARGSNTLPCKQKIYLRTPLGASVYPVLT